MASRIDANQPQIVETFRKVGALVLHLHEVGHGCPDLLIAYNGKMRLVEIKDGNKPPSKRRLTPDEQRFHADWRGYVVIVESAADALELIARMQ